MRRRRGRKAGPVRQAVRLRATSPASFPGMSDGVPPANRGTPRGLKPGARPSLPSTMCPALKPATPGLGRRSTSPPSPAEGGRPLLPPDDYHPARQAEWLTNAHVRGTPGKEKQQEILTSSITFVGLPWLVWHLQRLEIARELLSPPKSV